jgi:carbonic anhydrase/acetyltransferase-like protein (isoleucine patch superfamily)
MLVLPHHGVHPIIPKSAYVAPTAVIVGDVTLGEEASVWFHVVIRGDVNSIRIGARSNVQDNSTIHVTHDTHPTVVGDDVVCGHGVVLHGCTIRDRVLVGIGSIVLDGCVVGEESIIAAGTLLTPGTAIPPRSMVMGRPAKVIRSTTDREVEYWILSGARNYLRYKETYREGPVDP